METGENIARRELARHWDPHHFVQTALYQLEEAVDEGPISLDNNLACPSIEGYMERLPAGRRKATMWNSWVSYLSPTN